MSRRFITFTLLSAFALSACGVRGNLKTPPPIWGDKSKVEQPDSQTEDNRADDTPDN